MSELKPGMLALIVGTTGNKPETVGMLIEIESIFSIVASWTLDGERMFTMLEHLLPIKPEADPLEIKVNQELHA